MPDAAFTHYRDLMDGASSATRLALLDAAGNDRRITALQHETLCQLDRQMDGCKPRRVLVGSIKAGELRIETTLDAECTRCGGEMTVPSECGVCRG